jgi:hypothetical protein
VKIVPRLIHCKRKEFVLHTCLSILLTDIDSQESLA